MSRCNKPSPQRSLYDQCGGTADQQTPRIDSACQQGEYVTWVSARGQSAWTETLKTSFRRAPGRGQCAPSSSQRGKQNFVSKQPTITRTVAHNNNATVIATAAPAAPILTVSVVKAATSGGSARRIAAHSQLCAASSGSGPARYRPAMMTAYIPEVDSCYAADLTHCHFFPLRPPAWFEKSRGKGGRRRGVSRVLPGRKRSASLQKRGRNAAAVSCTLLH